MPRRHDYFSLRHAADAAPRRFAIAAAAFSRFLLFTARYADAAAFLRLIIAADAARSAGRRRYAAQQSMACAMALILAADYAYASSSRFF